MESNKFMEWAKFYASLGLAIFPLEVDNKQPITSHGCKDATTDIQQIEEWWAQTPHANIGIACGTASNGLVVIDLDQHGDKHGIDLFKKWMEENGEANPTAKVNTASGGNHLYYFLKEKYKNVTNIETLDHEKLNGIDIRADGGYIVAPPSTFKGKEYTWDSRLSIKNIGIKEGNSIVQKFLEPRRIKKDEKKKSTHKANSYRILEGERTSTLVSLIGKLKRIGLEDESIRLAVSSENSSKCNPPLSEKELNSQVLSCLKHEWEAEEDYTKTNEDCTLKSVADFEKKEVEWLVYGYIPKNQITMIVGTGGVGKTTLWCSLLAKLSQGKPTVLEGIAPHIMERKPLKCIFFSAEDTVEHVLKDRLEKSEANLENIKTLSLDDEQFSNVKFKNNYLEKIIANNEVDVLVFDPIQSFVGNIEMSDRRAVRQEIDTLLKYCKKYDITVIIIVHTNKQKGNYGRARMADTADLWDISRSILMVGEDDAESKTIYVSHEKCNYGLLMETAVLKNVNGTMAFERYTKDKDRDYVLKNGKKGKETSEEIEEVANLILSRIAEENGEAKVKDIDQELKDFGHNQYTIRTAKENLKNAHLIKYKKNGKNEGVLCTVPHASSTSSQNCA